MIRDNELFRRYIAQRLDRIKENQAREARREAERTHREENENEFVEEINISQEASLPALEDPSTADSQLERLDRRVENERKKKLKKRK